MYLEALNDCLSLESSTLSRVGLVYDLGPVCFELIPDTLNLITLNNRALNPFFAIAEAAWVIEGANDVDTLRYYLKSYGEFSDDSETLNGAYGYRLRHYFDYDQIDRVVKELRKTPSSRRCLLSLYSAEDLRNTASKDIPCNTSVMFKIRQGKLDISVINRSNDIYLGLPYNFFTFQVLHFYIAKEVGVDVGFQRHFIDSLHLYHKDINSVREVVEGQEDRLSDVGMGGECLVRNLILDSKKINVRDYLNLEYNSFIILFENYFNYKIDMDVSVFERSTLNPVLDFLVSDWLRKYGRLKLA